MTKPKNSDRIAELEARLSAVEKDDSLAHGDFAKVLAYRFKVLEDRIAALEKPSSGNAFDIVHPVAAFYD